MAHARTSIHDVDGITITLGKFKPPLEGGWVTFEFNCKARGKESFVLTTHSYDEAGFEELCAAIGRKWIAAQHDEELRDNTQSTASAKEHKTNDAIPY